MTNNSTKSPALQLEAEAAVHILDDWFDPIEAGLRERVREFIQTMIESELEAALSRPRYARRPKADPENADGPSSISTSSSDRSIHRVDWDCPISPIWAIAASASPGRRWTTFRREPKTVDRGYS